jgi:hypothetical protein
MTTGYPSFSADAIASFLDVAKTGRVIFTPAAFNTDLHRISSRIGDWLFFNTFRKLFRLLDSPLEAALGADVVLEERCLYLERCASAAKALGSERNVGMPVEKK